MNYIHVEHRGSVAILTISRPKALNALNTELLQEFSTALDSLGEARALVITGAGEKAFVAGADIAEMRDFRSVEAVDFAARGQRTLEKLEALAIPTIAAVNGFALGGGCELALACDLILCSPQAVFGLPEVSLGVIPGFGGTQRLVRRIGSHRARELIFTGRRVKAEEAVAIGLALRQEADVLSAALALGEQIAANGPVAVRLAKRAVLDGDGADLRSGQLAERNLFGLCFATADQKEGMGAFLERRKAIFQGQ